MADNKKLILRKKINPILKVHPQYNGNHKKDDIKDNKKNDCLNGEKYVDRIDENVFGILRVGIAAPTSPADPPFNPPYAFIDPVTGKWTGFDIELLENIVRFIPEIDTIEIINFSDPLTGFDQMITELQAGRIDIIAESFIVWDILAQSQGFSFLVTFPEVVNKFILFYKTDLGVIESLSDLATKLPVPNIIVPGLGSSEGITVTNSEYPSENIISIPDAVADTADHVLDLLNANTAGAFASFLTELPADFEPDQELSFVVLDLYPTVVKLGNGWVLNSLNCKLNYWLQFILDYLVNTGVFSALLTKYNLQGIPAIVLPPLFSISNHAINRSCLWERFLPHLEKVCSHEVEVITSTIS